MSARMPFLPLGAAQPKSAATPGLGNAPSFTPNSAHPLHRGSGQLDAASLGANPLPLAGLIGQRTGSHGVSASNIFSGLDIVRPQTTAPGKRDSPETQLGAHLQTADKDLDRIVSPTPLRVSHQKSPLLSSPAEKFKTPARPSHFGDSFGASPDRSTDPFGFSNAHIPTDIHQRGPLIRQLPSPDSDQSGASADYFQINSAAAFRTSTPHMRGHESEFARAQRIFPQNNYSFREQGKRHSIQQQVEVSMNRKRSRERYAVDNRDQDQPGKRQKIAQHPQIRTDVERSVAVSTPVPVDDVQHSSGSGVSSHQCVLNRIFSCQVETYLQSQMENFDNRVRFWQGADDDEWEEGLEELKQKFDKMLRKTQDFMKRKRDVIASLEDRIKQHRQILSDREKALTVAKENMLAVSQNMLAR